MSTEVQNEVVETFAPPKITLGAWLTQARQASGLSVQDLAMRTNRSVQQLTELESDNYQSFGAHVTLRGIIRQYVKTVGADEAQAVALMPELFKPASNLEWIGVNDPQSLPKKTTPMGTKPLLSRVGYIVLTLVVLALLAWWIFGARMFKTKESTQKIGEPNQVHVINPPAVAAVAPVAPSPVVAPATDANAQAAQAAAPAAVPVGAAALGLKINAPVWLEVKDAKGTVLLSGIQQKNDAEQIFTGELPLYVKIADGTKVQMSWKGQPYDLVPVMKNHGTVAKIERLE